MYCIRDNRCKRAESYGNFTIDTTYNERESTCMINEIEEVRTINIYWNQKMK